MSAPRFDKSEQEWKFCVLLSLIIALSPLIECGFGRNYLIMKWTSIYCSPVQLLGLRFFTVFVQKHDTFGTSCAGAKMKMLNTLSALHNHKGQTRPDRPVGPFRSGNAVMQPIFPNLSSFGLCAGAICQKEKKNLFSICKPNNVQSSPSDGGAK